MPGFTYAKLHASILADYAFTSLPDADKWSALSGAISGLDTPASPFLRVKRGRLEGSEWRRLRRKVFERDGYRCTYCGSGEDLVCDHVVPHCRGGSDALANLTTACRDCNARKYTKTPEEWKGGA